jgi:hypothetical protein
VAILTDGSGTAGVSRTSSSAAIVKAAGAEPTNLFGVYTDRALYEALLARDSAPFVQLRQQLQELIVTTRPQMIVCDAAEGFNPIHDLTNAIVRSAARLVGAGSGTPALYEFRLFSAHNERIEETSIVKQLEEDALERKTHAAKTYPELRAEVHAAMSGTSRSILEAFPDLAEELDGYMGNMSEAALGWETLHPSGSIQSFGEGERPFYERYAERLVAAGRYDQVIRYQEHVRPVLHELQND